MSDGRRDGVREGEGERDRGRERMEGESGEGGREGGERERGRERLGEGESWNV